MRGARLVANVEVTGSWVGIGEMGCIKKYFREYENLRKHGLAKLNLCAFIVHRRRKRAKVAKVEELGRREYLIATE